MICLVSVYCIPEEFLAETDRPLSGQKPGSQDKHWKGSGSALRDPGKSEVGSCPQGFDSVSQVHCLQAQNPFHVSQSMSSVVTFLLDDKARDKHFSHLGHNGLRSSSCWPERSPYHLLCKKPRTSAPLDPPGWWCCSSPFYPLSAEQADSAHMNPVEWLRLHWVWALYPPKSTLDPLLWNVHSVSTK